MQISIQSRGLADLGKPKNPYPPAPDEMTVIRKWAAELQRVYDAQTAGDFTFDGILGEFLRDARGLPTVTGR
jgi:hypothetical protein